jgi:fructan beta-fructosidase
MSLMKTIQTFKTTCLSCLAAIWSASLCSAAEDILIADFEGRDYGQWRAEGEAFGPGPARGTLPNQMRVEGYLGQGLVNSFFHGDNSTGTLTSPAFKVERRNLQFLIGGGKHPGLSINLVADGKTIRTATGPNDKPGGSERLDWDQWDVGELAGQTVSIQIVDSATGGWGHINIDQIIQTDRRLPGWITDARRTLTIDQPYLNLPVKNGAPKRLLSFLVDGRTERQFEIELADGEPDWWAFLDVAPFKGKAAVLEVDKLKEDSAGLSSIEQANQIKGVDNLYREKLRPQFHFTSRRGWINDPNGLVYYEGEYHLFYQHNPYGWNWGNMHWGHAISRDLVHWEELGEALYPDETGTMFSGSAVVDSQNTAGFQNGKEKAIVCIYTAAGGTSQQSKSAPFTQCLAYSLGRGRTWTKYQSNPVLSHIVGSNRDPKVIWDESAQRWLMVLYLDKNDFALFASPNLKAWERLSNVTIPGDTECPEFFQISLDGNPQNTRWIFYGGKGSYLVGRFDGKQFSAESGPHTLNFGNCFYASQTFNDLPKDDSRRVMIGWGRVALPGMPFNQMMNFPVELTLRTTKEGPRIFTNPVKEIESLRLKSQAVKAQPLRSGDNPLSKINGELLEIDAELATGAATEIHLNVRGISVVYDAKEQALKCQGSKAPLKPVDGKIRLRLLVDRASIEIFANHGRVYMPIGVILDESNRSLGLAVNGGDANLNLLTITELKSAWR